PKAVIDAFLALEQAATTVSSGSAASIRHLDERTLGGSSMPAGISRSWATGSGISSPRTDVRLRPHQRAVTGDAILWLPGTTGCGRPASLVIVSWGRADSPSAFGRVGQADELELATHSRPSATEVRRP